VVLVVAAVDVHLGVVDEEAGEEQDRDLHRAGATVNQVSVEHVRVVSGRQAVLRTGKGYNI
jgi:hypothetical protein